MATLFDEFRIGNITLANRVVMAPMTRSRASADGVLGAITAEYYRQRATAGLIITEATAISKQGSGYPNIPGIWNAPQTSAWKAVSERVHAEGGKIFMQLFHTGRIGHSSLFGEQPVAPSAVTPKGEVMAADYSMKPYEEPRALEHGEISQIVSQFQTAASNAKEAGFDGIELHAANGYLLDQFLRNGVNNRTDKYGGSFENRARFLFDVLQATISVFGPNRVGVRFSPFSPFNDMSDSDPQGLYTFLAEKLNSFPIAYFHIIDPIELGARPDARITATLRGCYRGVMVANGGLTKESGVESLKRGEADLICYGTPFISNPDLVERLRKNLPLTPPDRSTFYTGGEKGYTDYPRASDVR